MKINDATDRVATPVEAEDNSEPQFNSTPIRDQKQAPEAQIPSPISLTSRNKHCSTDERLARCKQAMEERQRKYKHWIEHGSESLEDAWVSLCPRGTSNAVEPWKLTEIVEFVCDGGTITTSYYGHDDTTNLKVAKKEVVILYAKGCREAEELNRLMLSKVLKTMSIQAEPEEVVAGTVQPKANEQKFFFSHITFRGSTHKCPDGYLYHPPEFLGKKKAGEAKKRLPAITLAALFLPERKSDYMVRATGLFPLDIDTVKDMTTARSIVQSDPHVALVFESVSGSGLCVAVRGPITCTPQEYTSAYQSISAAKTALWNLAAKTDEQTKDCARLRFLSYDPKTYINWNAGVFKIAEGVSKTMGPPQPIPDQDRADIKHTHKSSAPDPEDLTEDTLAARRKAAEDLLGGIDWENNTHGFCGCPGKDLHTNAANSKECRVMVDGTPTIDCRHTSCKGTVDTWNKELRQAINKAEGRSLIDVRIKDKTQLKDIIILPSDEVSISQAARQIFERIAPSHTLFNRGGAMVELSQDKDGNDYLQLLRPDAFRSRVEKFGRVMAWRSGTGGKNVLKFSKLSRDDAAAIMATTEALELLPPVANVLRCAVITEDLDGKLVVLGKGYHTQLGGILITQAKDVPDVALEDAVKALHSLIDEFDFQSDGDRSRSLAARITPALKMGGLLKRSTPLDVMEADMSQAGKGYSHAITAAIYNESPYFVVQRDGGVGSKDESLAAALVAGRPFISLDNVRGQLDSQYLESLLTSPGLFPARIPGVQEILLDPRRFVFQLTSNGMECTKDLANRASICRILKRRGHSFQDLPGCIKADQALVLGCVFSIIRAWHAAGKPRTNALEHDFREWCQILDWIVQNLLKCAPLLAGHRQAQERVSNPALTWLRSIAIAIEREPMLEDEITASRIVELCEQHCIPIPGVKGTADEGTKRRIVGGVMRRLFERDDRIQCEGFTINRCRMTYEKPSGHSDSTFAYSFESR